MISPWLDNHKITKANPLEEIQNTFLSAIVIYFKKELNEGFMKIFLYFVIMGTGSFINDFLNCKVGRYIKLKGYLMNS